MAVLAIMALALALVAPHVFDPPSSRLHDAARALSSRLSLAGEEARLQGVPLRWLARKGGYVFQRPGRDGEWRDEDAGPLAAQPWPRGVRLLTVRRLDGGDGSGNGVLFLPDGEVAAADIVLGAGEARLTVAVRPGGVQPIVDGGG